MPLNPSIKKVMLIGSGPIVIGQAAEFDYSGTQALRALKEEGINVVLVNSNPATIMTDTHLADEVYLEPLTLETIKRILLIEKPDSILSGFGGQTGLTLCMELAKSGFLKEHNITLLGTSPETIDKAEDRLLFKQLMESINQPCVPSDVVTDLESAVELSYKLGFPVVVRPAFTLAGTGGGIAANEQELRQIADNGLKLSPIHQILIEKSIAGFKEIEFETMRDAVGNCIAICSMENVDPVGIHTGDSIVIAPCITLADKEYQMLRSAALHIINALGMEGGCNVQFALDPDSNNYFVIEVNPRVSRSSALASKATGYPIAKVSTKIAIGYHLDEIKNAVTQKTYACFEPAIDYVAVKFPKWPFDKFVYAARDLGTQMKATGEVMSLADSFEAALMKSVIGVELKLETLRLPKFAAASDEEIDKAIHHQSDERVFAIFEGLYRGVSVDYIHDVTKIDEWFLNGILRLANMLHKLENEPLTFETYLEAKKMGYLDRTIKKLTGHIYPIKPSFKMVDTCAAEFRAHTPYFYNVYGTAAEGFESELNLQRTKPVIVVLGSGPIRIGQGIEFDYASVSCVNTLRKLGYEVVIINNNPETVSTDFDCSDRLYFEPLDEEVVLNIIAEEQPVGVVASFGGGTAIKLTKALYKAGVPILGSSFDTIDMAEDRERFDALLEELNIKRAKGFTVFSKEEAINIANELEYPVLLRPSYVLGGQNMTIAYGDDDVAEFMDIILSTGIDNPVLIDKYIVGTELEVDAIYDGENVLIPGIMQHIERSGVHSGDSIAVYPAQGIDDEVTEKIIDTTKKLCKGINALGIVNIQFIVKDYEVYIIEINPRASRTVPYISKVTGVPICELATRVMLGEKIVDLEYGTNLYKSSPYIAVKVPVFSFEKLTNVDTQLGPEMKSTGEVLGIGKTLKEALFKGLIAAGYKMNRTGGVFISVRDSDKTETAKIAEQFAKLKFKIYATAGTQEFLKKYNIKSILVNRISDDPVYNVNTLLESGHVNYVISTSQKGRNPARDSVKMRRKAVLCGIPCMTSLDTASAMVACLTSLYNESTTELVDITKLRSDKIELHFVKMEGTGNDSIYLDCLNTSISSPESLAVELCDRHHGIGADGLILILPPTTPDADAKMKMYDIDGIISNMDGNGIRCVAKYLYDNHIVPKTEMDIETDDGIKHCRVYTHDGKAQNVTVHMGFPKYTNTTLTKNTGLKQVVDYPINLNGEDFEFSYIYTGNDFAVMFVDNVESLNVDLLGSIFMKQAMFKGLEVSPVFAEIVDSNTMKVRVYERGNGETFACGIGCSAAVSMAIKKGFMKKNEYISVELKGGELIFKEAEDGMHLKGNARFVYDGKIKI